ncbi:unnamed protein product [Sympodiomycopsis kandeliae]
MPTPPAPTYQHYTVPIGGAPFIHPSLEQIASKTETGRWSSSQPPSPNSPSSSSNWSHGSSDLSSEPSSPPSPKDAALAYSKGLHQHTANMWESQRRQIEKERLDQRIGSPTQIRSPRYSQSSASTNQGKDSPDVAQIQHRSSALDLLLGKSRSRKEAKSVSSPSRGHKHSRSVV